MIIEFPELPYKMDGLEPFISKETLEYHYGKHHKKYFTTLTGLIEGTDLENKSIEDIIKVSDGSVFNNAAQTFNHTLYWNCMTPGSPGKPTGDISDLINKNFGSFSIFKEEFSKDAATLFGSGWVWLLKDGDKLWIEKTANAGCPIRDDKNILLTCDVWEHAYYIDYRNARGKYVDAWWNLINWNFVSKNI